MMLDRSRLDRGHLDHDGQRMSKQSLGLIRHWVGYYKIEIGVAHGSTLTLRGDPSQLAEVSVVSRLVHVSRVCSAPRLD
jgi:hypothetical protein